MRETLSANRGVAGLAVCFGSLAIATWLLGSGRETTRSVRNPGGVPSVETPPPAGPLAGPFEQGEKRSDPAQEKPVELDDERSLDPAREGRTAQAVARPRHFARLELLNSAHSEGGRLRLEGCVRIEVEGNSVLATPRFTVVPSDAETCCSVMDVLDRRLLVGSQGGLADVAVELRPMFPFMLSEWGARPLREPPEYEVEIRCCRFEPHVLTVPEYGLVVIRNADPRHHELVSQDFGLNLQLGPEEVAAFVIDRRRMGRTWTEAGTIRSQLDPWMSAHVYAGESELLAVTDERGRFAIEGAVPGPFQLLLWHAECGWVDFDLRLPIDRPMALRREFAGSSDWLRRHR